MLDGWEHLTPRERELVCLHFDGLGVRAIAEKLVIAPNTVKLHLLHAREKLDITGAGTAAWLPVAVAYGRRMERERGGT